MALKPITRQEQIIVGKNLEPITRMERFLKEYGGGTGGSVQSDWNQTDSSAADFIKNKPFGDKEAVLLEEQTFTPDAENGNAFQPNGTPSIGDTLIVEYDGVPYECEVIAFQGLLCVGNLVIFGMPDTGEPFVVAWMDGTCMVMALDASTNHTIFVSGVLVEKISERYVSNPVAKLYISHGSTSEPAYLCHDMNGQTKITQAELVSMVGKKPIVLSLGDSIFYTPVFIHMYAGDNSEYSVICAITSMASGITQFYTAEYTPET